MNEKKRVISLCLEFIEANGIEVDNAQVKQAVYGKLYNNQMIYDSDLGFTDICFVIAKISTEKDYQLVERKLEQPIENLVMLILTSSLNYNKKIEKILLKRKYDNSNIKVLMIGNGNTSNEYIIGIKSRIQAIYNKIEVPREKKSTEIVNACVYSACLYDIVKIYDELGDELFKKNVRLKVKKDNVGVGKEIKETLRNSPEQFWFLNNGITIVTNAPIDMSKNECISLSMENNNSFSVVNGAQTISAAHDFIYCDGVEKDIIENAKGALVLLRVVSVVQNDKKTPQYYMQSTESMSERISKALNRQKPIEAEDLAYYSPFVKSVNAIYSEMLMNNNNLDECDNRFFGIVRRGENESDSCNKYEHSLTLIARAIRASGYKDEKGWRYMPWKAVNTYNADILKMGEKDLKHSELFKTINVSDKDEFLINYQNINLAIYLYKYYADRKNIVNVSEYNNQTKIEIIKESGSWYFVTFFFEYLMNSSNERKLQPNCVEDFNEYIPEADFVEILKFFFTVMDDNKKEFKLEFLRQEGTYKNIRQAVFRKENKAEYKILKEKAQKLYITYEEGDMLKNKDYNAYIVIAKDKYILQTNSEIELNISDNCAAIIKELRNEKKEIIDDKGYLKNDIEFQDLSTAAKFVEGKRLVRGYKNWEKL